MSVAVRRAIYGKLAGDTTLNNLLGSPPTGYSKSIYFEMAPDGAAFPYVIFARQAETPTYTLGSRAFDEDVWLVKGVDRSDSADAVDNVAERLDALLTDGAISISGRTQLYLRRETGVSYPEESDGMVYRHHGSNFRLIYQ